jgi:hypothetical protein
MILHDKKYKYEFLIDTFQHCKLSHITPNVYVTFYLNYIAKHLWSNLSAQMNANWKIQI